MKFSKTTIGGSVEILASKDFQSVPIKVAAPGEGTLVKAGTPLTSAGESTTGSGAVGILGANRKNRAAGKAGEGK